MENDHFESATVESPAMALDAEGGARLLEFKRPSALSRVSEVIAALGIVGKAAGGADVVTGCTSDHY